MQFFSELISRPSEHEEQKGFDLSEDFDQAAFFGKPLNEQEQAREEEQKDFILSLQDESEKTVATFSAKVTADTFAAGASLTTGLLSGLGSFISACGAFCLHGLGGTTSGLGGLGFGLGSAAGHAHGLGGLNVDSHGNFRLSGSLDSLSRSTGLSRHDLLSGKYSAEGIVAALMDCFGKGVGAIFGFSLVETLIDGLIPSPRAV